MDQSGTTPASVTLRALRVASGKSLRGIAREVGVSGPAVQRWERGECRPNSRYLAAYARALGLSLSEVLALLDERAKQEQEQEQEQEQAVP